MYLNELFTRHRRTEPTSVIILRLIIMTFLISCFTGYIVILVIEVTGDEPVLKNSIIEAEEIPIPGMCCTYEKKE